MESSILSVAADVRNEEQVNTCVRRAIEVYGAIDILVNNAGIHMPRSVIDTDLGTWSQTLDTNIAGHLHFLQGSSPSYA
jgi:NADP-dependent 3-hydroxy acid dehydrogenase YdfG